MQSCDVLVVGGGASGGVAALTASDAGVTDREKSAVSFTNVAEEGTPAEFSMKSM